MTPTTTSKARITDLDPSGLAARAGLQVGDLLLRVNGQTVTDLIDFQYLVADTQLDLDIQRGPESDEVLHIKIDKDYDQSLGLGFEMAVFDRIEQCKNKCTFCFVYQTPRLMRRTLYLRDDDYRLSFTHGNFVTLTNMSPAQWRRIYRLHLSPLFVSVHTTRPDLRAQLIGNPKARLIHRQLRRLEKHGIDFHAQIVLCPDLNDGKELQCTIRDLTSKYSNALSICIVPLILTRYHRFGMTPVGKEWAKKVIEEVRPWQEKFLKERGEPFVHVSDEFFILADEPFPPAKYYGDFHLMEDGIGTCRKFIRDFNRLEKTLPAKTSKRHWSMVSGMAPKRALQPAVDRLNQIDGLTIDYFPIPSPFWGGQVSVSGLITGQDLIDGLHGKALGQTLLLPDIMFKRGDLVTLDDMTVATLESHLGVPIRIIPDTAEGLVDGVLDRQAPQSETKLSQRLSP